ncbi:13734_t:CDS:2, partial [Funneliformis caledonium]
RRASSDLDVMDMLSSKQDEQDLSQSYEASSESIRSTSCVLSKQPQVNAFKLVCNLKIEKILHNQSHMT